MQLGYWAVAQTESQRESTAAQHLAKSGFTVYLPRLKIRRHGLVRTPPLFPTYLFVRVIDRWWSIAWTIGVLDVLMSGDHPARLADNAIDEIKRREVKGYVQLPKLSKLKKGDQVRVVSGRFQGQIGLYDGMTVKDRERVLLDLLGRMTPVELAKGDAIEPLQVAPAP